MGFNSGFKGLKCVYEGSELRHSAPRMQIYPTAFGPNCEDCEIVIPVGILTFVKDMERVVCYLHRNNYIF